MAISAQAPFVSVLVWPVDPEASNRTQWTLSENYAGCFLAGSDGGTGDGAGIPGFQSVQFANQPAFINLTGPVDFVRFTGTGRVERGGSAAGHSNPDSELCGLTIQLRRDSLCNTMEKEPRQMVAPRLLTGNPPLLWVAEMGEWETVVPASAPPDASVHPYGLAPNTPFKIKTKLPWDADRGFVALFDFGGVCFDHAGEPAVRLNWGNKWSLVFRGQSDKARPTIERREKGKWVCVRVLSDCRPLDELFWITSHTVRVQIIGNRLCVDVDGVEYGIVETHTIDGKKQTTKASWSRAPLKLSVWGAEVLARVHRLTGDSLVRDKDGNTFPLEVTFGRQVPAPDVPPFEVGVLDFGCGGHKVVSDTIPVAGSDPDHPRGSIRTRTLLQGTGLGGVEINGFWMDKIATYTTVLRCSPTTAPLLCSVVAEFMPLPTQALPEPIEIRAAVSSLSVDSGDPENLPDAEAQLSLSHPLLEKLLPNWRSAILPYRPILIRAKYPADEDWTTLFRGFLTPDSLNRDTWNDKQIPLIARGPLVRLSEPAALVDERFGPLDLQLSGGRAGLWGAEAAKRLLTIELGAEWTDNFNGDGNAFRYIPEGHYPLITTDQTGYFDAIQAPPTSNWRFPPPFGNDLKSWINSIAKYDCAVWFFDAPSDAFYYGRIIELFIERGHTRWSVPETAPPPYISTTDEWPLLSALEKSGLLEKAFNDIRVWGVAEKGSESFRPSFILGRAGDSNPNSLDPISIAQSWRRTLLLKPDFVKTGVVDTEYANSVANAIWQGYKGRPPTRMDAHFETGFLGPRWGELLHLPTGFDGPQRTGEGQLQSQPEDWRILRVKHSFDFTGSQNRFSTTLTTRTLSATGQ